MSIGFDGVFTMPAMLNRRTFLATLAQAALAFLALPEGLALAAKKKLSLAKFDKLRKVGGSVVVTIDGRKVLVVRSEAEKVNAVDPTCTHKKCQVAYDKDKKQFRCKCHGSRYELSGKVVNGPAPRPLTRFDAELKEDAIILTL